MKKFYAFAGGLVAVAVLAIACNAIRPAKAQVTNDVVAWNHPTTRTDATPLALTEILQSRVAWSRVAGGPYTDGAAVVAGPLAQFTRSSRPAGRFCYAVVTIDTAGLESALSSEACSEKCPLGQRVNAPGDCVAIPRPNPPTNVRVT